MEHMGITIDPNKDSLFDQLGVMRLKESYMTEDEISPQERFAFVSKTFGSNIEHAQRLYDYVSKHWLSYSTPILSYGRSKRGLPISCYLNYIDDTAEGLVENLSETNWLSMLGGGVGIGFGIRWCRMEPSISASESAFNFRISISQMNFPFFERKGS